jgi:hypothetical protein
VEVPEMGKKVVVLVVVILAGMALGFGLSEIRSRVRQHAYVVSIMRADGLCREYRGISGHFHFPSFPRATPRPSGETELIATISLKVPYPDGESSNQYELLAIGDQLLLTRVIPEPPLLPPGVKVVPPLPDISKVPPEWISLPLDGPKIDRDRAVGEAVRLLVALATQPDFDMEGFRMRANS